MGNVQVAKLRKQSDIHEVGMGLYCRPNNILGKGIVNWCLGDIKNYLKNRKLEQVVAIIKSCTPNSLGDLTVTLKDLSGGSEMLMEEEEIVKLIEEKEIADLELHVCGNVTDQEDLYKFDEEALNLTLEKEARQAWAEHECWRYSANHIQCSQMSMSLNGNEL
uniref:Uncharacterized protein n=1 Tax=Tanacetum cinerariifolium TaxID=118510 RepID=A0A6L2LEV2_TANCI|nr:hypothetical protein [Tanacetum cinerariifolium]